MFHSRPLTPVRITKQHGCTQKWVGSGRTGISLRLLSGEGRNVSRLDELRNIIEVRKWQVNQAASRYIRSHEAVQHISIRDRNDFMQQHGTALAAALAPELMGHSELTAIARTVPYSAPQMPCVKPFCPGLWRGKLIIPHRIATFNDHRIQAWRGCGWQPWKIHPCAEHDFFCVKCATGITPSVNFENPPVFTEKSHASIRCTALHAFSCLIFCIPGHARYGLSVSVQLH